MLWLPSRCTEAPTPGRTSVPAFGMIAGQLALVTAALFTGAAIYVSAVEHPARMTLEPGAALLSLALIGFLSVLGVAGTLLFLTASLSEQPIFVN